MTARTLLGLLLVLFNAAAFAAGGIKVEDAWVRATAPGQRVAGAFLNITADADLTLIAAKSGVCKETQLHTMRIEDGVMVMRRLPDVPLPKGETVRFMPGGKHIMLIDLNHPIKAGARVKLTLVVKDAAGRLTRVPVVALARPMENPPH